MTHFSIFFPSYKKCPYSIARSAEMEVAGAPAPGPALRKRTAPRKGPAAAAGRATLMRWFPLMI